MPPITLAGILIVLTVEHYSYTPSYSLPPEKYVVSLLSPPVSRPTMDLYAISFTEIAIVYLFYLTIIRFFFFPTFFSRRYSTVKFEAWTGWRGRTIKVEKSGRRIEIKQTTLISFVGGELFL